MIITSSSESVNSFSKTSLLLAIGDVDSASLFLEWPWDVGNGVDPETFLSPRKVLFMTLGNVDLDVSETSGRPISSVET